MSGSAGRSGARTSTRPASNAAPVVARYFALFAAAFALYAWLWPQAPVIEGDSPQYLEVARDLTDFRLDTLHDRTPGYPLFLALTGSAGEVTRQLFHASLLLHLASSALLALLLRAAGAGRPLIAALCVVVLLPPYVEPAAYVMTETLAQFTLVTGLACLVLSLTQGSRWLLVLASVAFGASALTRPAYQLLAPSLAVCLVAVSVFRRDGALPLRTAVVTGAVLIAGSAAVIASAASANYARFGYFGLTPAFGFHLSTKTMTFVERLPEEYATVREILVKERDREITERGGLHTGTQTIWAARPALVEATGLSKPELAAYLVRMNLTLIRRAPIEYLQEVARSLAGYWFPAAGRLASLDSSLARWSWTLLHFAIVAAFAIQLIVLGGVTIYEASRRQVAPARGGTGVALHASLASILGYFIAGTIVFYTMIISCVIDIGEVRQRRATDLLIIFMCVLGAHMWRQSLTTDARASSSE
jgi:hypothetical protein